VRAIDASGETDAGETDGNFKIVAAIEGPCYTSAQRMNCFDKYKAVFLLRSFLCFLFIVLGPASSRAEARTPTSEGIGYVVIKNDNPVFELSQYLSRAEGSQSQFKPPLGRVARTWSYKKATNDKGGSYEVLLDNGRGKAAKGFVNERDVAFFKEQSQAENFAEVILDSSKKQKSFNTSRTSSRISTSASGGAHGSKSSSNKEAASTVPSQRVGESTVNNSSSLRKISDLNEAQNYLGQIQVKLKAALGESFVKKAKPNWQPSRSDRLRYLEAIDKVLDPQEKAFFAMVSTSFAEDRMNTRNSQDPHDPQGRASMLLTMKTIENRTKSRFARQFMEDEFMGKESLEKIWGVITANKQFSSWNEGSSNFGNTIRAMLGVGENEAAARNRALVAYLDFSSGKVNFEGFEEGMEESTLMLNREEVQDIHAYMKKDLDFRRSNPYSIVSWTVESIMHNPRYRPGIHQVALRVPSFSIRVPKANSSEFEYVKVDPKQIGHWPVYLKNVATKNMEAARLSQGGW
jgi:hypothetical protein